MCLSAAPWTAPCGPTDWSSLFPSQRGTQRSLAGLRLEPGHRGGLARWVSRWARRLSRPWSARQKTQSGHTQGGRGRNQAQHRKTQQKRQREKNTRGGPEILMLSSHNNLIYFYPQQSSQEEQEVYGQSSKKTGGLVTQCLALWFNLMYINKLILYLPSLISSMNASPAFFWIEFCHSWRERKNIYYSHKDCMCI